MDAKLLEINLDTYRSLAQTSRNMFARSGNVLHLMDAARWDMAAENLAAGRTTLED